MAVKSILEIDVQDDKFKDFNRLFEKYRENVSHMPGQWGVIAKGIGNASTAFEDLSKKHAAAVMSGRIDEAAKRRAAELVRRMDRDAMSNMQKLRAATAALGNDTARVAKHFASMNVSMFKTARSMAGATTSLLKWTSLTGVFSALIGAGGLFGIDRLAEGVANQRRANMGTGVGYGQQRAFSMDYGRFVDADGMMAAVSSALSDKTSKGYVGLRGAGISDQFASTHNAADVSVEVLKRLPGIFKGVQPGLVGATAQARGLTDILSVEDIKRYLAASPEERKTQEDAYRRDSRTLDVDPATTRAWQDLTTQLGRAKSEIETTFVTGLVPLAGPIADVSKAFTDLATAFLKSDVVKDGIAGLASGLEAAAKYVSTQEFKDDMKSFADGVGDMARSVRKALEWLGLIGTKKAADGMSAPGDDATQSALAAIDGSKDRATGGQGIWHRGFNNGKHGFANPRSAMNDDENYRRFNKKANSFRDGSGIGGDDGGYRGPVPGASGYGAIDVPYTGKIDAKSYGDNPSPKELHEYLIAHGATINEALMLTGAAGNESGYNPKAVHDKGNGYGMWGHNLGRIDMRGMSWQQEADAALQEAKKKYAKRINDAKNPEELAIAEAGYESPQGYTSSNPKGAHNYTGRFHTIQRFADAFGTFGSGAAPGPDGVPGHVRGNLKIDGENFAYGSGGVSGSAHIPFGNYPINPDSGNPWGQAHNAMDVNGNGNVWDASLGRMRTGIEMHEAHSVNMVTEGCMAFLKEQYPHLKEKVREMIRKNGHAYLHVGEHGASITSSPNEPKEAEGIAFSRKAGKDALAAIRHSQKMLKHDNHPSPLLDALKGGSQNTLADIHAAWQKDAERQGKTLAHPGEAMNRARRKARAAEGVRDMQDGGDGARTPQRTSGLGGGRFQERRTPNIMVQNNTGANVNVTAAAASYG